MRELGKVMYAPFRPHIGKYETMEANKLLVELDANTTTSKDILDELRLISLSVPKLITSFNGASERCCKFSEGKTVWTLLVISGENARRSHKKLRLIGQPLDF